MAAHDAPHGRPGPLARAWDGLLIALAYLMAALLAAITIAVLFEVIARYFFNRPTIWAVDFTEYALVYVTFFGSAWTLREHAHVRVDMLFRKLPPRGRLALSVIVALVAAGVMAVFVWKGYQLVWDAFLRGQVMLKAWPVPRWVILLPIPAASLLMVVEFLRQAWESIQGWRRGATEDVHRRMDLGAVVLEDERAIF